MIEQRRTAVERIMLKIQESGSSRDPSLVLGYHVENENETPEFGEYLRLREGYLGLGKRLLDAKKSVTIPGGQSIINLRASAKVGDLGYFCEIIEAHSLLGEFDQLHLKDIASRFIEEAGIPDSVSRKSNWMVLQKILAPRGYEINRKIGDKFYSVFNKDFAQREGPLQVEII